eukprot:TRINITY_DN1059_c0_g2_i2.p1 TRINITY_DN1059_c0_g2~~TRINITY_DN1059_c0_g2_i2.p1  ORF type:complete len:635 (-),score=177.56 TRINITY_DN1059_c0_g2_i2:48-1952(-)
MSFERVLWRALRGNMIFKHSPIDRPMLDLSTGELVRKSVFVVWFQGEQSHARVRRMCDSFGARMYNSPDDPAVRAQTLDEARRGLSELAVVLDRASDHKRQLLAKVEMSLKSWVILVRREKAVYHTLNKFNYDHGRKCLIAEGWCPAVSIDRIHDALITATKRSGATVPSILETIPTKEEPPTFFPTNKFTWCMHCIIDAYGTARYGEINPTTFSLVTFPFLFAVMFGDVGHALFLLGVTIPLILYEQRLQKMEINEIFEMLFNGRYVLLLMSLFSIYTGLIYNEIFGLGIPLLKSTWFYNSTTTEWHKTPDRVYEFGIDYIWKGATNELYYYNSFKMKLAVILGVTQMMVGIFVSLLNNLHWRKWLNIIFEFIPQVVWMMSLFGYLVILIFVKWTCTVKHYPYLINVIIDIFLHPGLKPDNIDYMYEGQTVVQIVIFVMCVLSVLAMLFPKPIILYLVHRSRHPRLGGGRGAASVVETGGAAAVDPTTPDAPPPKPSGSNGHGDGEGEEFDFSEVFIHQSIYTIEFLLGSISNTASYLRLWALSLAHAELSIVFYEQLFVRTIGMGNFLLIFVGFAGWAGATIGVLLVMEALSAFLHALRLHWVEFQNKFYQGDGYKFEPLAFATITGTLSEQ